MQTMYLPVLLVKAYGMISLSPGPTNIYVCFTGFVDQTVR